MILWIVFSSFKFLFLVSSLQSSQNTRESLLLGSLCSSKQALHMLWPQARVRGLFNKLRQLKQLNVFSIGLKFISFCKNISFICSVIKDKSLSFDCNDCNSSWLLANFDFAWFRSSIIIFSWAFILLTSISLNSSFLRSSMHSLFNRETSCLVRLSSCCNCLVPFETSRSSRSNLSWDF